MKIFFITIYAFSLLAVTSTISVAACSHSACLNIQSETYRVANKHISKQQAANIAKEHMPGRVLAVKRKGNAFRVKILRNNGNVIIVYVNAKTGKIK